MPSTVPPSRHLIVLGHPRPGSFNHQVAERYRQVAESHWQEAEVRDLYALGFDPLLRAQPDESDDGVSEELARLHACDVLVLVYPIWFGTPPAIIKGYVERVLGAGFRPEFIKSGKSVQFGDKRFLTLSSSATTLPWLNEKGQWESLRQGFDRYLAEIFGFREAEHVHFDAVVEGMPSRYAQELLLRAEEAARYMCSDIAQDRHHRAAAAALSHRGQ